LTASSSLFGVGAGPAEAGAEAKQAQYNFLSGGTKENASCVPPELGTGYPEPHNIGIMPAYGVFARHVRDLELANIRVGFEKEDLRPAMVCVDVNGLEIDNFKARLAAGVPAAKFETVKGLVIRNSPALQEAAAK